MIKREKILSALLASISILIISLSFISATACLLDVSIINQDPYPAIPGDYVKLIFQVDGAGNPSCGDVDIKFIENFPFSLDPGENAVQSVKAGFYSKDYSSLFTAPYKVRVDNSALDGDNPLEVLLSYTPEGSTVQSSLLKKFQINIKDKRTDFEIHVKDYLSSTDTMTLEVLNIGKNDIKALTIEIPKQKNIVVKGSNKNVLGDLDSNEYTTADFEVASGSGEFTAIVSYTDEISVRRTLNKTITFDPTYFQDRKKDEKGTSPLTSIIIIAIIAAVGYFFYKRYKKNKHHRND